MSEDHQFRAFTAKVKHRLEELYELSKPRSTRMLRKQVEIFVADNYANLEELINQFLEDILPEDVLNISVYFDQKCANIIYLKDMNDGNI